MAVKNYKDAKELTIPADAQADFDNGVARLKQTMQRYGFSKEAADQLEFTLGRYSLTVGEEERRGGAFHTQADGQPFYAITLKAPGSFEDGIGANPNAALMTTKQQVAMLATEFGFNVFTNVERAIGVLFGVPEDTRNGGAGSPVARFEIETTTRRDLNMFFTAVDELAKLRLKEYATQASTPSAPKRSSGGPTP